MSGLITEANEVSPSEKRVWNRYVLSILTKHF